MAWKKTENICYIELLIVENRKSNITSPANNFIQNKDAGSYISSDPLREIYYNEILPEYKWKVQQGQRSR